jgi:hypothetical protein
MLGTRTKKLGESMRRKMGPVGLSLAAAAVTAVGFAAVSVAADDKGGDAGQAKGDGRDRAFEMRVGPPPELSEEDEAALEEFRQCMEDNGAPGPPEPGEMRERLKDGEMPEPPSEAEMEKLEKAHEACEDKLPEGVPGGVGCARIGPPGSPGGPPPGLRERGTAPPSGGNENQGYVVPAPQGATS